MPSISEFTNRGRIVEAHHAGQNLETIQAEGRTMYTRIVTVLRECQKAWPLAETWCNGLEKWYKDPNPKRISFQAGTMTDGVSPSRQEDHS